MHPTQVETYVSVGSNIDPERNIAEAIMRIRAKAEAIAVSTFYRTRPLTRPEQQDFRNGMLCLRTTTKHERVELDILKPIEADLGRVRTADKHAARAIDLDVAVQCEGGTVLWVDEDVMRRNFIAVPLAELAPELRLPNGRTVAEVADALGRKGLEADDGLTQRLKELTDHE